MKSSKHLKINKAPVPSEIYAEMIMACWDVRISVDWTLQQNTRILDNTGGGMLDDWSTSVAIPIFKGKCDVMNCGMQIGFKTTRKCSENRWKGTWEKIE